MTKFGSTISRNGFGAAPAALMLGTITFSALGLGVLSPSASAASGAPIIPGGASSSTATSTVTSTADADTDVDTGSSASIPSGAASDTTITSTATATMTATAEPDAGADVTGTATATDITPTPYADAGATADDDDVAGSMAGDAAAETAQPEDLAVTGSSTQNLVIALAVMGLIAVGGYSVVLRRSAA